MTTNRTAKSPVTFRTFNAFADGSGIECVASCDGYTYAVDFVCGEVRCTLLGNRPSKIACAKVRHAFARRVALLGGEWRDLHDAMYAA